MKERLRTLITHLQHGLVERDEPARLALLAALAGEHLLLLGPPGTAKSELARRLQSVFAGGAYFERLLTKFSVPEELFGPLSIKALEQDRYQRLTERYLPQASIAFIDEIFKANSAILNALLTLLNEREFDNGAERVKTPLIAVVGASNELPEGEELDALYDRFLLRYEVGAVSEAGFEALLDLDEAAAPLEEALRLTPEELAAFQRAARTIPLSAEMRRLLADLRSHLSGEGRYLSDRRWRKVVKLLQVAALTNGHDQVTVWEGWLLRHCLWDHPDQRAAVETWYQRHLGTDAVVDPERLRKLTETWERTLAEERERREPLRNEFGEALYRDAEGNLTTETGTETPVTRDGDARFLAPHGHPNRDNGGEGYTLEALQSAFFDEHYRQCHIEGRWVTLDDYTADAESRLTLHQAYPPHTRPYTYGASHIESRVAETRALLDRVVSYRAGLEEKLAHLDEVLEDHLWVESGFTETARRNLEESVTVVEDLTGRIESLCDGFASLPSAAGSVPEIA